MYQFNHRVVANGTPLDRRFDNVALAGRRAGYSPAMFGYTDQSIDPRDAAGPDDPRLSFYEGVLPGFDALLDLQSHNKPWVDRLGELGYDTSVGWLTLLKTERERPEQHSLGAFLTDRAIDWIGDQDRPWFAHLSYLRPHPPYSAPGEWSHAYDPADVGEPIAPDAGGSSFYQLVLMVPRASAPTDPASLAHMRAQYFGMISHVDNQLGRLWDALERLDMWDDTLIVVTADHAEMLGDHGLRDKLGYWEQSYFIPCIVRDPSRREMHGTVVDRFTENVDVMPTICDAIGVPVPSQCDGYPLTPYLEGTAPSWWRSAAHWEFDWRNELIRAAGEWPWDRTLERQNLAVVRNDTHAYVQFGNGDWLCFDLVADPTWRTTTEDPAVVLPLAQAMLLWRSQHTERTLTDMLVERGGIGRWPPLEPAGGVSPAPASTSPR